ncbi:MAG: hypothetical protein ACXW61_18210 [Gemmatirosa sp.]
MRPRPGARPEGCGLRIGPAQEQQEQQERQALADELAAPARAWREAEEIAVITADLLLAGSVRARLDLIAARRDRDG